MGSPKGTKKHAVSPKRCDIGPRLLWWTTCIYEKSHT